MTDANDTLRTDGGAQSAIKRPLDENVAIVTGGNSGIGKAIAVQLAEEGANVLVTGRNQERLDAVAEQNPNIEGIAADITVPEDTTRTVVRATERWDGIDILVNNAGPGVDGPRPVGEQSWEYLQEAYETNAIGPTVLLEEALSDLKAREGTVVNVTSTSARRAHSGASAYSSSKAALEQLTRVWALELAPDVRVNAVAPGPTETRIMDRSGFPEERIEQRKAQQRSELPLGRRGDPEEVAAWVVRLVDPRSSWVTGQVFSIDGGQSIV